MTEAAVISPSNTGADPLIGALGAAETLLQDVSDAVESLVALIEEETRLVRLGALFAASDLQPEKSRLSTRYVKLRFKVRENAVMISHLPPDRLQRLTERHEAFANLLRINMAVLATAREVAEDIIRNVATEIGKTRAPNTYGPQMRLRKRSLSSARGLSVDRKS
jgi:hypothetical protein